MAFDSVLLTEIITLKIVKWIIAWKNRFCWPCEVYQVSFRFFSFPPISSRTEWRHINAAWLRTRQFQNGNIPNRFLRNKFPQNSILDWPSPLITKNLIWFVPWWNITGLHKNLTANIFWGDCGKILKEHRSPYSIVLSVIRTTTATIYLYWIISLCSKRGHTHRWRIRRIGYWNCKRLDKAWASPWGQSSKCWRNR